MSLIGKIASNDFTFLDPLNSAMNRALRAKRDLTGTSKDLARKS